MDDDAKEDIYAVMLVLAEFGPSLGRPRVDSVYGSSHSNMKELRVQSNGRPIRIFFAFDPNRQALLLCGGDKTGDKRFYEKLIEEVDQLFLAHLKGLKSHEKKNDKKDTLRKRKK